ncbi:putative acrylyl-CoA reductase AcuI [Posidoniimonas polymericola]|uniref:Putative acrylyl-CoA reductase AcuI n=1 Tax=Posidoniimonas polymericola TaxID=2528002 RepID=A0A5C5YTX2_9BACT|nr:YhdH/YhfP family quinone oxidoreductase [Posidoniimonas polymericola]TWT78117.1 putative acrylyl-CoA reductase AcuI [Posidoniimonas polymericola]
MNLQQPFPALVVRSAGDSAAASVENLTLADLPPGEVVIEVEYSSLNYKDALASQGHPGVVRQLPHVPGIDCAGRVVDSTSDDYQPGDAVLVTGYELGSPGWGGYSQYVRVPAEWVVAMPAGLTPRQAMIYGTAGFTAAQCVAALIHHGVEPSSGPVVVSGATGGVGTLSVAILAKLGYEVTAVSGKADRHDALRELGAAEVAGRELLSADADRPLLKSRWAGVVDTVGGVPLATLIRSTTHRGCVAACGLTAGEQLPLTVHPFILRGVNLAGIDSAKCPRGPRMEMWRHLSGDWQVDLPDQFICEVTLDQLPQQIESMLASKHFGRTLVVPKIG